ncbi:MAG: crossover junction endodeoxyribonuclease RuvC, partial [Pseudoclavibacter sp.]
VLRLDEMPKPADAADALALAICSAWKTPVADAANQVAAAGRVGSRAGAAPGGALTPAQRAWAEAERRTRGR